MADLRDKIKDVNKRTMEQFSDVDMNKFQLGKPLENPDEEIAASIGGTKYDPTIYTKQAEKTYPKPKKGEEDIWVNERNEAINRMAKRGQEILTIDNKIKSNKEEIIEDMRNGLSNEEIANKYKIDPEDVNSVGTKQQFDVLRLEIAHEDEKKAKSKSKEDEKYLKDRNWDIKNNKYKRDRDMTFATSKTIAKEFSELYDSDKVDKEAVISSLFDWLNGNSPDEVKDIFENLQTKDKAKFLQNEDIRRIYNEAMEKLGMPKWGEEAKEEKPAIKANATPVSSVKPKVEVVKESKPVNAKPSTNKITNGRKAVEGIKSGYYENLKAAASANDMTEDELIKYINDYGKSEFSDEDAKLIETTKDYNKVIKNYRDEALKELDYNTDELRDYLADQRLNFEQELERTRNVESAANALSMGIWGDWKNGDFGDVDDPRSKKIRNLLIVDTIFNAIKGLQFTSAQTPGAMIGKSNEDKALYDKWLETKQKDYLERRNKQNTSVNQEAVNSIVRANTILQDAFKDGFNVKNQTNVALINRFADTLDQRAAANIFTKADAEYLKSLSPQEREDFVVMKILKTSTDPAALRQAANVELQSALKEMDAAKTNAEKELANTNVIKARFETQLTGAQAQVAQQTIDALVRNARANADISEQQIQKGLKELQLMQKEINWYNANQVEKYFRDAAGIAIGVGSLVK